MKISSKSEFHSLVKSFSSLLADQRISIKTTRAQELLAHSFGFRSANALLAVIPAQINLNAEMPSTLRECLVRRHSAPISLSL